MKKKLMTIALLVLASTAIFLPYESYAATSDKSTSISLNNSIPQKIKVRIGRQRRGRDWNRGKHKGWYKGNHNGWGNRRSRTIRQVYWRNGVRYVRYVRVRA